MARTIVLIAHNIRSLWNVGSLFRSSDAFHVSHIHLTGYTGCPPREEISKTALGAEEWIPWSYDADPADVIAKRKAEGFCIVALEKTKGSIPLSEYTDDRPIALILGHEVSGVSDTLLKMSEAVVHIPMSGKKESLNVSTAAGIALYALTRA